MRKEGENPNYKRVVSQSQEGVTWGRFKVHKDNQKKVINFGKSSRDGIPKFSERRERDWNQIAD